MGEMIDGFNALHSVRALERATLRESAPKTLAEHGIEFTPYNNGAHLLVSHNCRQCCPVFDQLRSRFGWC